MIASVPIGAWVGLAAVAVVAAATAYLIRRGIQRREALKLCAFGLREVGIRPTGLASATLRLVFRVSNPGPGVAVVDAIDYRVVLGERPVAQGSVAEHLVVQPGEWGEVPVTVMLDAITLGAALVGALLSGERRVVVTGLAHIPIVGGWKIRLPMEGEYTLGRAAA